MEAAGCYCEYQGRILFLKRPAHKTQGNRWGMPAGKVEPGEDPKSAVLREIYEEIGVRLDHLTVHPISTLFIRLENMDYTYYSFHALFTEAPSLILCEDECAEARWMSCQEALELPLVFGGIEALNLFQKFRNE